MKRTHGIINDFFGKIAKLNRISKITLNELNVDYELTTEFVGRNCYNLSPVRLTNDEFNNYDNVIEAMRKQVDECRKRLQPNLNAYHRDNEDSPAWFADGQQADYAADELEIIYSMYKYMFLSDDIMTKDEKQKYRLTQKDMLIVAKAMTLKEGSMKKNKVTPEMKRRLEQFNSKAVGGFVRHMSDEIVMLNIERVLSIIVERDAWVEVIPVPTVISDSPKNSLYAVIHYTSEQCECNECEGSYRETIREKLTGEEMDQLTPHYLGFGEHLLNNNMIDMNAACTYAGAYIGPNTLAEGYDPVKDDETENRRKDLPKPAYAMNFEIDTTFNALRIILEAYTEKDRIVLSRVGRSWYMAVKSKPLVQRLESSYFFSHYSKDPELPMTRYIWEIGFRFNRNMVDHMIRAYMLATNHSDELGSILNAYWDMRYDATGAICILLIIMMEQHDPTYMAYKSLSYLTNIMMTLPHRILDSICSKFIYVGNPKFTHYSIKSKKKLKVKSGEKVIDTSRFMQHCPIRMEDSW